MERTQQNKNFVALKAEVCYNIHMRPTKAVSNYDFCIPIDGNHPIDLFL